MERKRLTPPLLILLGAICAAGAVMRFVWLGQEGFWLDELLTALMVRESGNGLAALIERVFRTDVHPPLYYLLASGWAQVFGTSEFALRSLSAVIGAATPVLALWALRRHLRPAGMVVLALLLVCLPITLEASQQARAYPLLILAATLATGALLDLTVTPVWDRVARRRLVWLTAVLLIGCWLHYFTLTIALGIGAMLLLRWRRHVGALRSIALAGLIGLALTLIWLLPHAIEQAGRLGPGATWIDPAPTEAFQALLAGLFGDHVGFGLIALAATLLVGLLVPWRSLSDSDRNRLAVLGGLFAAMLGCGLLSALFAPSLTIRTVAAFAPPLLTVMAMLAQAGLEHPARWRRIAVAGLLVAMLLPPLVSGMRWLTIPHFPQWRESAKFIFTWPGCHDANITTFGLWHPADYYRARFAPGSRLVVTELYGNRPGRRLDAWQPDADCPVVFWGDTSMDGFGAAAGAMLRRYPDLQVVHFRDIMLLLKPGARTPPGPIQRE